MSDPDEGQDGDPEASDMERVLSSVINLLQTVIGPDFAITIGVCREVDGESRLNLVTHGGPEDISRLAVTMLEMVNAECEPHLVEVDVIESPPSDVKH